VIPRRILRYKPEIMLGCAMLMLSVLLPVLDGKTAPVVILLFVWSLYALVCLAIQPLNRRAAPAWISVAARYLGRRDTGRARDVLILMARYVPGIRGECDVLITEIEQGMQPGVERLAAIAQILTGQGGRQPITILQRMRHAGTILMVSLLLFMIARTIIALFH
jgi:hypothetical protein